MTERTYVRKAMSVQDLTNLAFQFQTKGLISAEITPGKPPHLLARGRCPQCGQTFDINMPMSIAAVGHLRLGKKITSTKTPGTSGYTRQVVTCNARLETNGDVTECGACFSLFVKRPEG